jgi:hypothetical protein
MVDHIPADHREMVRFKNDSESGGFQKVLTVVARFVAGATEDVANGRLPKDLEGMFLVPFPQNTAFVGREPALHQLERILRPEPDRQRRAALWGLGGIG